MKSQARDAESAVETWISYSDLMSFIALFFMMQYSFSQRDTERAKEINEKVAEAFDSQKKTTTNNERVSQERRDQALQTVLSMMGVGALPVSGAVREVEKIQEDTQRFEQMKNDFAHVLAGNGVFEDRSRMVRLTLAAELLFDSGSAELSTTAKNQLKSAVKQVLALQDLDLIEVSGHTDSRKPSRGTNWQLSSERASAVAEFLIEHGVERRRISVRGMADLEPLFPEFDVKGAKQVSNMNRNRRIEIKLSMGRR